MLASVSPRIPKLVLTVLSRDNHPLKLTHLGLERAISQLPQQPLLKSFVKKHYRGDLNQAVVRAIAKLVQDSSYTGCVSDPRFSRKLRVFKTSDKTGIQYKILTFPVNKIESAIVAIQPLEEREVEEESSPAQCGYLLEILRKLLKIPADTPIGDAIKTIYTTNSKDNVESIRFSQGQVKGKGTGMANASNRPDISFYHSSAERRVNIEIDLDTTAGRTSSDGHEQNLLTWDKNAVGIFLIIDPSSGSINHDLSRVYQPTGLTDPNLKSIIKDAIGESYTIKAASEPSTHGEGKIRRLKLQ